MSNRLTTPDEIVSLTGLIYKYDEFLCAKVNDKVKLNGVMTAATQQRKNAIWEKIYSQLIKLHPRLSDLSLAQLRKHWSRCRSKRNQYIEKFYRGEKLSNEESGILDATGFDFILPTSSKIMSNKNSSSSEVKQPKNVKKDVPSSSRSKPTLNLSKPSTEVINVNSKRVDFDVSTKDESTNSMTQQSHFTDEEIISFCDVIGPYETYLTTILGEKAKIMGKSYVVRAEKKKEIWGKVFQDLCRLYPRLAELGLCKIQNHWRNWRRKTSTLARKYNTGQGLSNVELAVFNAMKENIVSSSSEDKGKAVVSKTMKQEPMDEEDIVSNSLNLFSRDLGDNWTLDFLNHTTSPQRPQRVVRPKYNLVFNSNGILNRESASPTSSRQDIIISSSQDEPTPANTPSTTSALSSSQPDNKSLNLSEVLQIVDYCTKNNKKFEILEGALVFRDRKPDEETEIRIPLEALGKRIEI
ncbi:unnamed protein product [Bursaphelenchus okinawaensis]|uniref:Uncharacterized protein n=1 Tax=Bursaphelenchus okinawaensis TaxID=465554 RepID=A0A811KJT7_9BILA|nr:unnamed protein product [Bursaphelenchus okinawaensis]CAG9105189.1 unnamed protein product [Bursaphelenchus okinawaensis]